jgi:drug/metabolite transporter (DMT)-like permease
MTIDTPTPPLPRPLLGVALVIAAAVCFAAMDTTVSFVGTAFGVAVVLWVRYAVHAVAMGLWIGLTPERTFRTANPLFQIARGALLAFSSSMAFAALQRMPVAEFTSVVMLTPMAVTLLAWFWLKEPVSRLRWALVIGGFIGALVVVRPGMGVVGWAALMPLAATASNAGFQILTTRFAAYEDPFTTNFYTGATGVAIATPILLATTAHPFDVLAAAAPVHLVALVGVALLGTTGHLLLIMALGKAPASTLMPFQYTQLAAAALGGWIVFGVLPDRLGLIGMAVIGICGAAAVWLNVRDAAARRRPVTPVAADTVGE